MPVPPILEECSIDYRNCGSWKKSAEVGTTKHTEGYMRDYHGINKSEFSSSDQNKSARENQWLRKAEGKKGMINSKTLQGLNSLESVKGEMDAYNAATGTDGGVEARKNMDDKVCFGLLDQDTTNYGRYTRDKEMNWEYRQQQSEGSPFEAGVSEDCGHRMNLFTPYDGQDNVYSTIYGENKYQGDFIFVSDGISVYDYLTLPDISEDNTLINQDNPSSHMPIGINFSV